MAGRAPCKPRLVAHIDNSHVRKMVLGNCEGSRLVAGTRLVVFPRLLTPCRVKNTMAWDPYPLRARTSPPVPLRLWDGARRPRLERESCLVPFPNCGWFGRGIATSQVPSQAGTPCLAYLQRKKRKAPSIPNFE